MNINNRSVSACSGVKLCLEEWLGDENTENITLQVLQLDGNLLNLPVPIFLPNGRCPLTQIYVRRVYLEAYEYARKESSNQRPQMCVTGTPGTG